MAPPERRWRPRYLMLAPYRLGFFLALVQLTAASVWWALVQAGRAGGLPGPSLALPPALVHAVAMVYGFMPLFFAGFLFTALPKWLRVAPWPVAALRPALLLQALGGLLWLLGAHAGVPLALAGALLAALGLAWMALLLWRLIRRSRAPDTLHPRAVGLALVWGVLCLLGVALGVAAGDADLARASVLSGLWGCMVVVFVTMAHRMVPFFTSPAMPFVHGRHAFWLLWLMWGVAGFEVLALGVEGAGLPPAWARAWQVLRAVLEGAAGLALCWVARVWALAQSLRNRMMAMLHIGFLWLGAALLLAGAGQVLALVPGAPALGLGALHALTMGCLGSLLLAMVTRVAGGHSGRALAAERLAWPLFWCLQAAVLLRIAASVPSRLSAGLLLAAALCWAAALAWWTVRLGGWCGRLRPDGRPG
ncbi:MAG: NnrS family protein [Burkholderiales bacterium]|nr:NnrS family protein [Burkholderiales bacterium]